MGFLKNILEARADRVEARQQGRTERAALRADTKQTAYSMGINPNQPLSDLIGGATDIAKGFLNKDRSFMNDGGMGAAKSGSGDVPPSPSSPMGVPMYAWLIGGVAVVWFLMKKK
jgi:hypothetical protein